MNTDKQDFSLVTGGPLFQLFRKIYMTGTDLEFLKRRIIIITLFTWVPLFVFSALGGTLIGGNLPVPFLLDFETHIRYLIVLPLLISAELIVHQRMKTLVSQFRERNLIPERDMGKFDSAITSSMKLRNSIPAEILIILFVYIIGVLIIWFQFIAIKTNTWYMASGNGESGLSLAGIWLGYVSLPVFQFILLRWYYRLFIWIRFLWKISRINLSISPLHPDRVGGLGFLSTTVFALIPLVTAHGALLAGMISNRIFYLNASLLDFKMEVGIIIFFMFIIVLGPLFVFSPMLAKAKRTGRREYGTVAQDYVREFDSKWLRGNAPKDEPIIGSADIQSLADLGNSYEIVKGMNIIPFSKEAILQIVGAALLPLIPLALTLMPLEDLLKKLIGIIF